MNMKAVLLAAAVSLMPAAAMAQTAPTPTPGRNDYKINQRKVDQQRRIAQGVRSGELTASKTARLERQEAGINREERAMRMQNNGRLTRADRRLIHKQQNQESLRIYRAKHNNKVG